MRAIQAFRSSRVTMVVTAIAALLALVGSAIGFGFAHVAQSRQSDLETHQVDKSPGDVKRVWTDSNLEKSKHSDPMPVIVDE